MKEITMDDGENMTQSNKIKLSIVLPVYNMENYLRLCLDCLVSQDVPYDSYEIICVDDGSIDGSLQILQEYSEKYSCISIISQENAGHAAARNTGLKRVLGEYVWFVDSDDAIDWNCFGKLFEIFQKYQPDELCIEYRPIPASYDGDAHKNGVGGIRHLKKDTQLSCSGIRVFKTSMLMLNNILWDARLSPCDDIKFVYQVKKYRKKVVNISGINYYHRQRDDSASHLSTLNAKQKSISSFLLLADFYNSEYMDTSLTKKARKNVLVRRNLCIQSVLLSLTSFPREDMENCLEKIKESGYYPYKHIAWNLKPKISLKRALIDYAVYLFPNEKYYRWFYDKRNKNRKRK